MPRRYQETLVVNKSRPLACKVVTFFCRKLPCPVLFGDGQGSEPIGATAIQEAAAYGYIVVEWLLNSGNRLNVPDERGGCLFDTRRLK